MVAAVGSILSAASLTHLEDIKWAISLPALQVPKWTRGGLLAVQFKDPKYLLIWMFSARGDKSLQFSVPGAESTLFYDCDRALLRMPPGNRLEALRGDRKGQFSIRFNEQYRVCFRWHKGDAYEVELVDYH